MVEVIIPTTDKQLAFDALQRLPESATLDQMSEELAILAEIRRAEVTADAGNMVPHDEVVRRSALWITK